MFDRELVWIGENITVLRRRRCMRQEDLARAVGVTRQKITAIEAGDESLKVWTLCRIASVLGVKASDIFSPLPRLVSPSSTRENSAAQRN